MTNDVRYVVIDPFYTFYVASVAADDLVERMMDEVGGAFDTVSLGPHAPIMGFVNDMSMLDGQPYNELASIVFDRPSSSPLFGGVVVAGRDHADTVSIPDESMTGVINTAKRLGFHQVDSRDEVKPYQRAALNIVATARDSQFHVQLGDLYVDGADSIDAARQRAEHWLGEPVEMRPVEHDSGRPRWVVAMPDTTGV